MRIDIQFVFHNVLGKEHALVMCNHRSDIDWLVGWVVAQVAYLRELY